MGDDAEEQFAVEDIVAFTEQDLREYAPAVQLYFGEAMRLRAPALKQLCDNNHVEQTELREEGPYPTWTKARISSTPSFVSRLHRRTTPGGGDSATGQSQQDTSIMCSILQGLRHFA